MLPDLTRHRLCLIMPRVPLSLVARIQAAHLIQKIQDHTREHACKVSVFLARSVLYRCKCISRMTKRIPYRVRGIHRANQR